MPPVTEHTLVAGEILDQAADLAFVHPQEHRGDRMRLLRVLSRGQRDFCRQTSMYDRERLFPLRHEGTENDGIYAIPHEVLSILSVALPDQRLHKISESSFLLLNEEGLWTDRTELPGPYYWLQRAGALWIGPPPRNRDTELRVQTLEIPAHLDTLNDVLVVEPAWEEALVAFVVSRVAESPDVRALHLAIYERLVIQAAAHVRNTRGRRRV